MKKRGIRKLVTWCIYVPATEKVLGWYPTKKEASKHFAFRAAVIVKMTGLYPVPMEGLES